MTISKPIRRANPIAKKLRREMPPAEAKLWSRIKSKQLAGFHFRRQHTIGPYIADFVHAPTRLVIELDGDQHGRGDHVCRDAKRDHYMENQGWLVLRFWNHEVLCSIDDVLHKILYTLESLGAEQRLRRNTK